MSGQWLGNAGAHEVNRQTAVEQARAAEELGDKELAAWWTDQIAYWQETRDIEQRSCERYQRTRTLTRRW